MYSSTSAGVAVVVSRPFLHLSLGEAKVLASSVVPVAVAFAVAALVLTLGPVPLVGPAILSVA